MAALAEMVCGFSPTREFLSEKRDSRGWTMRRLASVMTDEISVLLGGAPHFDASALRSGCLRAFHRPAHRWCRRSDRGGRYPNAGDSAAKSQDINAPSQGVDGPSQSANSASGPAGTVANNLLRTVRQTVLGVTHTLGSLGNPTQPQPPAIRRREHPVRQECVRCHPQRLPPRSNRIRITSRRRRMRTRPLPIPSRQYRKWSSR